MGTLDAKLFYLINKGCQNPIFDISMPWISYLGNGQALFILFAALLFIFKKNRKRISILVFAGLTMTYYIVYFLKEAIARPRPSVALPDVHILEASKTFSFPSGHSAQAFIVAFILASFFKRGGLFFSLACLVAFSRVYVGVHYVSDVLAGAVIGIISGYILINISKKEDLF